MPLDPGRQPSYCSCRCCHIESFNSATKQLNAWFDMTQIDKEQLPAILTTEDVLAYLRVTHRTIYRLVRSGELPAVRIGRQWRFRRTDLDDWIDRQSVS
jgi:excisionase family DNA binding protein